VVFGSYLVFVAMSETTGTVSNWLNATITVQDRITLELSRDTYEELVNLLTQIGWLRKETGK
jgi:hypothetical protein